MWSTLILDATVLCLVSGNCHGPVQLQAVTQYQYSSGYYKLQALPLYVVQDTGSDAERLRTLEDAVLKLTTLVETQQLMLQSSQTLQQTASKHELQARAILKRSCVSCHSGDSPKGGFAATGELDTAAKMLIAETVLAEEMPPNKPLSAEDAQLLYDWSREDRAAVRELLKGEILK